MRNSGDTFLKVPLPVFRKYSKQATLFWYTTDGVQTVVHVLNAILNITVLHNEHYINKLNSEISGVLQTVCRRTNVSAFAYVI